MNRQIFLQNVNSLKKILWGYSLVMIFMVLILALFPAQATPSSSYDNLGAMIMLVPVATSILLILIQHKKNKWNIFKVALEVYSLFLILITFLGLLFPSSEVPSAELNYLGFLMFVPVLVFFWVFQKEVFEDKV